MMPSKPLLQPDNSNDLEPCRKLIIQDVHAYHCSYPACVTGWHVPSAHTKWLTSPTPEAIKSASRPQAYLTTKLMTATPE